MFASDVIYHFLLLSGNFVFIFLPQMSDSNSDWSLGSNRNECGHKCSITSLNGLDLQEIKLVQWNIS